MNEKIRQKEYYEYATKVLNGQLVAGRYIHLACERFLSLLQNENYFFDEKAVDKVIYFCNLFKHYTGEHSGKHFKLELWQTFIIANLYGFYVKNTNKRLARNAYILIARKNGKTFLGAALALYHLIADGEDGGQIFFAANSRQQAKDNLFEMCSIMAQQLDPDGKYLTVFRDTVKFKKTNSFVKVVSADTSKLDGYNLSFAIADEGHEYKDNKMLSIIRSAMGNRSQPLLFEISTAGYNLFSPCKEKYDMCVEVLEGVKNDDSLFPFLFSLDQNDDWINEKNWIKSNPNLNVSISKSFLQNEVISAKNLTSMRNRVMTKNFNLWCSSDNIWIDEKYILKNTQKLDIQDFKECEAYVGVDLASVSDLTAVNYLIIKNNKYHFITNYYLPITALEGNSNSEKYKQWQRDGILTITDSNTTDYDYIVNDLIKNNDLLNIQAIAYDSWNATQWAIKCTELGLNLQPYSQALGNFNRPTKEFERLLLSDNQMIIDDNEITRYCFSNVTLKYDHNDNCKPIKKIVQQKIDGVIAMLTALGYYLTIPHYSGTI